MPSTTSGRDAGPAGVTYQPTPARPAQLRSDREPGWTVGRALAVVVGTVLVLVSLALLAGGSALLWTDLHRDNGYVTSPSASLDSQGYAVVSERVNIGRSVVDWGWQAAVLGTIRLRIDSIGGSRVFVGVARADDVARYLRGVERTVRRDLAGNAGAVVREGAAPTTPPTTQRIWAASASGAVTAHVAWKVASGDWAIVVMNADASRGVHATADIGATAPALGRIATGLLVGGGVALLVGVGAIVVPISRAGRAA
jgi:hypothetical protein